jgi:hypothetical protein
LSQGLAIKDKKMYKQDTKTGENYWTEIKYKKTPARLVKPDKNRVFYFYQDLYLYSQYVVTENRSKRTCQNGD